MNFLDHKNFKLYHYRGAITLEGVGQIVQSMRPWPVLFQCYG
jgi:hypothetical protein